MVQQDLCLLQVGRILYHALPVRTPHYRYTVVRSSPETWEWQWSVGMKKVCVCIGRVPYRRKFSRDEIFVKSLKTGFSRLFVCDTSSNILYNIWSICDYIFAPVSSTKFVKISSLDNFRLCGMLCSVCVM